MVELLSNADVDNDVRPSEELGTVVNVRVHLGPSNVVGSELTRVHLDLYKNLYFRIFHF
jgi:hypothetical protein